jgi:hypothetical protein
LPRTGNPEPPRLLTAAAAYAAAELLVPVALGGFFESGRAEALPFLGFRPWLLLAMVLFAAPRHWRSRLMLYGMALALAAVSETILLLALGAGNPWPEMLRGLAAGAGLAVALDLLVQAARRGLGRWGVAAAGLALAGLLFVPKVMVPYGLVVVAAHGGEPRAHRPPLMLMTGLPIIWGEKGAFDPGSRPAAAYLALREEYDVRPLDVLDSATLQRGRLLLLAQPRWLAPSELFALDQWVRGGGRALVLTDPALAWPSALALGDIRRPPPALLKPLLDHWGVRLGAASDSGLRIEELGGRRLAMAGVGRFASTSCRVGPAWLARCRIGAGAAILVADADLLDDRSWVAPGASGSERHRRLADNPLVVADLLDALAGLDRERLGGRVEWVAAGSDRKWALCLALLPILFTSALAGVVARRRPG